jgi:excisionase family DNA binding protein
MLKIEQAMAILGYTRSHLTELCRLGKVPAYKVGKSWLFKKEELEQFINSKKVGK